jgi:peptidoglycan/LPS O-acetylase OafA/YrhL
VVSFHYARWPPGGQVGVDVFFVLSGFLITTLLLEERAEAGRIAVARFYRRRARRLYPALAVLVAVYLIVTAARGENRMAVAGISASYGANLVDAFGHPGPILATSLNPLWSLAQEEQFYLVWPVLLIWLARSRHAASWILGVAALAASYRAVLLIAGASPHRVYYGPDTHADALLVGAAFAAARLQNRFQAKEWAGKLGVSTLALGAIFGWVLPGWAVWGEALFVLGIGFLVSAAVAETALADMLGAPQLVWLGKRSYGLYLWHLPAMYAGCYLLGNGLMGHGIAFAAAVTCAAVSYRYVEQPFRQRVATGAAAAVPRSSAPTAVLDGPAL